MSNFLTYLIKVVIKNKGKLSFPLSYHRLLFQRWSAQLQLTRSPLQAKLPWITLAAQDWIDHYILQNHHRGLHVFEFGSGGSTLYFLNHPTAHTVSVEHDEAWYNTTKQSIPSTLLRKWTGLLHIPENNPSPDQSLENDPSAYYTGVERHKHQLFKAYVTSIDKYEKDHFDIILVDGRSRPACIMHAIPKLKSGGILVYDNAERRRYFTHLTMDNCTFNLALDHYGALNCTNAFVITQIYVKK